MRATPHRFTTPRLAHLVRVTPILIGLASAVLAIAVSPAFATEVTGPVDRGSELWGNTRIRTVTCSPGSYTDISPCSGSTTAPPNSTGKTVTFGIHNSSSWEADYVLHCSFSAPVTSCSVPSQLLRVSSGSSAQVILTYSTGSTGGSGSVSIIVDDTYFLGSSDHAEATMAVTVNAPTYTVAVTPDGTSVSAEAGATNTQVFRVKNNGAGNASYSLICSNTMGTCSVSSPLAVSAGVYKDVSVSYHAGPAGTPGTVGLTASYGGYSDGGSVSVTPYSHTVAVTPTAGPDGTAVTATADQNNTASFTIKNTGTAQAAYSMVPSCPGTTGACSLSVSSNPLTLNPGVTATATVTYGAGADLSTGSAHLTATYTSNTAVKDEGWISWTAIAPCQSVSADANLSPCTQATRTVLANTSGIKDTLTLSTLSGAPSDYTLACASTGPVTCTASGSGTVDPNASDQIIMTATTGASDGNATTRVIVTTASGRKVSASLNLEVLSPTGIVVSTNSTTTHLDAGQSASHAFTVHNAGSLAGTFRLDKVCTGIVTQCVASATQVILNAGASDTVSVSFVVDSSGGSGTVGLKATHVRSNAVTSTATAPVAEDRAPVIVALTPYNGESLDPARCVAACFAATASYTTPAYTSLDVARAVTLVYSSTTADPRPIVQADIVDPSAIQASKFSLRLQHPNGSFQTFANDSQEIFFTNAHALRRMAVQFDTATSPATGGSPYTLIITSYWDGTTQQAQIPIHVLVDNERASPYGAGWNIAGLEHLTVAGDSVLIVDGTGAMSIFRRQGCSASTCTYLSPSGDFSTLTSPVTVGVDSVAYSRRAPDGTTVYFTQDGREKYVQNRFGTRTTYGYDTANRLATITDPVGQITTIHYNAAGKLDYIEDPMGRQTLITVNAAGDLTQIRDAVGGVPLQATYDSRHRLKTLTDRAGHTSDIAYDAVGKVASMTLPTITVDGQPARPVVQYGSLAKAVLPASGVGTSASPAPGVDTSSVRASVTDPRGNTTHFVLNRFGQATLIEEPLGRVSLASYDDQGRLKGTTSPSGHHMGYDWSGPDLILTADGTTGQIVHLGYESTYHQVDSVWGDVTRVINDWSGGKLLSTNVGGAVTRFTYDNYGRLETSTDPLGHVDSVRYAATGLQNDTSVTTAERTTFFTPDSYGRVVSTTSPDGAVTTTVYDPVNRVQRINGPIADVTTYTYGDSLHLTAVLDAEGQLYQSAVNALGWVEGTTDPSGHTRAATYDLAGNVITTADREGHVITRHYNALSQLDSLTADGQTTTYSADPTGLFVATSNAASTDTTYLDAIGRPDSEVTVRGTKRYVRASTYDTLGVRTKLAISGAWSASISYGYDSVTHQLTKLTDLAGGVTTLGYNGDQLADTVRLPTSTGLTVATSYPSTHTASALTYSNAALNSALGAFYGLTPTMQIGQRVPAVQPIDGSVVGREFQYDSLGRLTAYDDYTIAPNFWHLICQLQQIIDDNGNFCILADAGSKDTTYLHPFQYDMVGNRTDSGAVIQAGNRLTQYGDNVMEYDLDGNLTLRSNVSDGSSQAYTWNALGQLVEVTTNNGTVAFTYDGFGRRVSKTSSNGTTGYVYDGQNLLAELDESGHRVVEYTYYPGIDRPHSVRRWSGGTSTMYYYAMDLPNNVAGLIDSSNTLVNHYMYTPFGTLEDSSVSVPNSLRFGARQFDSETGLYYNRARYYDPTLGRFISEDPIGLAGGINKYVYAGNDPINRLDPTGACEIWGLVLTTTYPDGHQTRQVLRSWKEGADCELPPPPPPGGGGGQSNGGLPKEPNDCHDIVPPAAPVDNPSASIDANIEWVRNEFRMQNNAPQYAAADNFTPSGYSSYTFILGEWIGRVFPRWGDWDYKRNYKKGTPAYNGAADFGNFSYGATCSQFMSQNACESYAGLAGLATLTGGDGIPFISGAKGDLPRDNYFVRLGYRYATCGKK